VEGKYPHVRERLDVIMRAAFDDDVEPDLLPALALEVNRTCAHVEELDMRVGRIERAFTKDAFGPGHDW
jgi:hypothetical protein